MWWYVLLAAVVGGIVFVGGVEWQKIRANSSPRDRWDDKRF